MRGSISGTLGLQPEFLANQVMFAAQCGRSSRNAGFVRKDRR